MITNKHYQLSKKIHRVVNIALLLIIFILLARIITFFIPWYKHQQSPLPIISNTGDYTFHAGEVVPIKIERRALISMQGTVTRELVRIEEEEGVEYEVARSISPQYIDAGKKTVVAYFKLPTLETCPQMIGNTYVIRGTFTYSPFGLWNKTFEFSTIPFHIDLVKKAYHDEKINKE